MAIDVSAAARGVVGWSVAICLASSLLFAATGNDDGRLVDAARGRDASEVRALLDAGADANARQPDGATALHWAAHWDDAAELASLLLRAGADVDADGAYGVTPLSLAAANASAFPGRAAAGRGGRPERGPRQRGDTAHAGRPPPAASPRCARSSPRGRRSTLPIRWADRPR